MDLLVFKEQAAQMNEVATDACWLAGIPAQLKLSDYSYSKFQFQCVKLLIDFWI